MATNPYNGAGADTPTKLNRAVRNAFVSLVRQINNESAAGGATVTTDNQLRPTLGTTVLPYQNRYLDHAYASSATGADFALTPQGVLQYPATGGIELVGFQQFTHPSNRDYSWTPSTPTQVNAQAGITYTAPTTGESNGPLAQSGRFTNNTGSTINLANARLDVEFSLDALTDGTTIANTFQPTLSMRNVSVGGSTGEIIASVQQGQTTVLGDKVFSDTSFSGTLASYLDWGNGTDLSITFHEPTNSDRPFVYTIQRVTLSFQQDRYDRDQPVTGVFQGLRVSDAPERSTTASDFTWREIDSTRMSTELRGYYRLSGGRLNTWEFPQGAIQNFEKPNPTTFDILSWTYDPATGVATFRTNGTPINSNESAGNVGIALNFRVNGVDGTQAGSVVVFPGGSDFTVTLPQQQQDFIEQDLPNAILIFHNFPGRLQDGNGNTLNNGSNWTGTLQISGQQGPPTQPPLSVEVTGMETTAIDLDDIRTFNTNASAS